MLDMNPTTLSKFNVWLVDDERDIFAMMLPGMTHEPSVRLFRWYPNCDSALTAVTEEPAPDVIILDINMPGMNGVDAIPLFQKTYPSAKIIMLTVDRGMQNIIRATTSGVSGYLLKPFNIDEVLAACKRALTGGMPLDPDVAAKLIQQFPMRQRSLRDFKLTSVEQRIVELIVDGATNPRIAVQQKITLATVKSHINHVFTKLNVKNRSQLISKVLKERLF